MRSNLIQNLIHHLEVGAGARYLRFVALAAAVIALGVLYDVRSARSFSSSEAMDTAQLAHNIASGQGYTTKFIRPFSLYLVQSHSAGNSPAALSDTNADPALLKTAHPDLANAPVYPVMLAGLMKVFPFDFNVEIKRPFWSDKGSFQRYQPEFLITIFNELLLLVAVLLTFLLAKNLFDSGIAWLSAILVLCCEELWHFSAAGISTILLLNIFLLLSLCLLRIDRSARDTDAPVNFLLPILTGALVGFGALTRYSFAWLIIPVTVFLILFGGGKRFPRVLAMFTAFVVILVPWIVRNELVSGTAFGTAGYALIENTAIFPKFQLERSLHPDLSHAFWLKAYFLKLAAGLRDIFENALPRLGGSWASILFLAGLLLRFRSLAAQRLRYFVLMCLAIFIIIQALGRTGISEESTGINSENLLILLAPVVFIYGASFFFTLLGQIRFALPQLQYLVIFIFAGLCCLPMFFSLMVKSSPVNYPPYYPPEIEIVSGYMNTNELMMSDVPWAVAWYGNRQCVWLSLDAQDEFTAVNKIKPVQALYLTPKTTDGRFLSDWMEGSDRGWGNFLFQMLTDKRIPTGFPLTKMPTGYFPERIFLTDRQRW